MITGAKMTYRPKNTTYLKISFFYVPMSLKTFSCPIASLRHEDWIPYPYPGRECLTKLESHSPTPGLANLLWNPKRSRRAGHSAVRSRSISDEMRRSTHQVFTAVPNQWTQALCCVVLQVPSPETAMLKVGYNFTETSMI